MMLQIKTRLSAMMFLEYFIWGAWYVTLGTWLATGLRFSGEQVALAAGATAIGAMVAPFFVGLIADRMFSTERILALLHGLGAVTLFWASRQSQFGSLYGLVLLYCLLFMPTLALTNSLAFRQMNDPKIEFGPIRVLGTLGWIVAGLLVGTLGLEKTAEPMRIAAASSLAMALYCLTLPHTPPLGTPTRLTIRSIFPREAVDLLRKRSMVIFVAASFLICIPLQFYYAFTNLFLTEKGVTNAAGKMTGGQMSELICMLLIPWFFRRLGVKYMLVAGMSAWTLRYLLFAFGGTGAQMWMLWAGILLHGICYDFFFVTGQIYIDREAAASFRAAAQGLITFITYGAGMLVGSWLSGEVVDHYTVMINGAATHQWQPIWLVAAGCSALVLLAFLPSFHDDSRGRVEVNEASGNTSAELPV